MVDQEFKIVVDNLVLNRSVESLRTNMIYSDHSVTWPYLVDTYLGCGNPDWFACWIGLIDLIVVDAPHDIKNFTRTSMIQKCTLREFVFMEFADIDTHYKLFVKYFNGTSIDHYIDTLVTHNAINKRKAVYLLQESKQIERIVYNIQNPEYELGASLPRVRDQQLALDIIRTMDKKEIPEDFYPRWVDPFILDKYLTHYGHVPRFILTNANRQSDECLAIIARHASYNNIESATLYTVINKSRMRIIVSNGCIYISSIYTLDHVLEFGNYSPAVITAVRKKYGPCAYPLTLQRLGVIGKLGLPLWILILVYEFAA